MNRRRVEGGAEESLKAANMILVLVKVNGVTSSGVRIWDDTRGWYTAA